MGSWLLRSASLPQLRCRPETLSEATAVIDASQNDTHQAVRSIVSEVHNELVAYLCQQLLREKPGQLALSHTRHADRFPVYWIGPLWSWRLSQVLYVSFPSSRIKWSL